MFEKGRLEKEKDTLNKEMLVLRVRFDNLEEKIKYLEGQSRTRKSAVIRDLSEIKKLLIDLEELK